MKLSRNLRACRFFAALAAATLPCASGLAQAPSQADRAFFEIKPHHTAISVPNLEVDDGRGAAATLKARGVEVVMGAVENATEIFFFVIRDNSGNAFELIQFKRQ